MHPTDEASLWPDKQLGARRQVRQRLVGFACASAYNIIELLNKGNDDGCDWLNHTSYQLLCPNRTYVADVRMDMDYNDDPENLPHTYSPTFNPFTQSECGFSHTLHNWNQKSLTDWIFLTKVISNRLLMKQSNWKVFKLRFNYQQ